MLYNYNCMLFPCVPFLPPNCDKPPTVYAIMESIVNGNKNIDDYTKIKDLASIARTTIFNFSYPLSNVVSQEQFETMILNHFLMRRINFETVTAFRIQLNVKLNEIMPKYNVMFDALEEFKMFDGETINRNGTDNRTINSTNNSKSDNTTNSTNTSTNNASNTLENTSNTSSTNIEDKRNSDMPQNQLDEVKNGNYLTNYQYNTSDNMSEDTSKSEGSSQANSEIKDNSTSNTNTNTTNNSNDNNVYQETIKHTISNRISSMIEYQNNLSSIYTLIFNDLEPLFYQIL